MKSVGVGALQAVMETLEIVLQRGRTAGEQAGEGDVLGEIEQLPPVFLQAVVELGGHVIGFELKDAGCFTESLIAGADKAERRQPIEPEEKNQPDGTQEQCSEVADDAGREALHGESGSVPIIEAAGFVAAGLGLDARQQVVV